MAAKHVGSWTKRASHSPSRARNSRPVWSTTAAGAGAVGPSGRRRLPACGSRSLCSSDSPRTSIAGSLRVAPLGRPPAILSDHYLWITAFWDQTQRLLKFLNHRFQTSLQFSTRHLAPAEIPPQLEHSLHRLQPRLTRRHRRSTAIDALLEVALQVRPAKLPQVQRHLVVH